MHYCPFVENSESGINILSYYNKLKRSKNSLPLALKNVFFYGDLLSFSYIFMIYKKIPKKIKTYWITKYNFNEKFFLFNRFMLHSLKIYFLIKRILNRLKILLFYSRNNNAIGFTIFYNQYFLVSMKTENNLYYTYNSNLMAYIDSNSILNKFNKL